jgi:transcriptional antiterminator RfaH
MPNKWYALRTKPHKERPVHQLLQAQQVEVFFPSVRVHPVNPRSARLRPYFPGYLFVRADLEALGANAFSWMPGGQGLVSFGGDPAIVPDNLIHELKQRVARIQAAGGLIFDNLSQGDRVRIVGGPFAGYEAIFDMRLPDRERVQVLLAFLSNYPQKIQLDAAHIEKVRRNNAPWDRPAQRPR